MSRFDSINHSTIQSVIAFATFLPFDLKELLYHVLGTSPERRENFEKLYETYRMEIYSAYVNQPCEIGKDCTNHYKDTDNNKIEISALWPPTSLFNEIKGKTLPENKVTILNTFKGKIKSIFNTATGAAGYIAGKLSERVKDAMKQIIEPVVASSVFV